MPAHVVEALTEAETPSDHEFGVWPENWDIVTAFSAVASQWRVVSLSTMASARIHYQGLDYTAVDIGLKHAEIAVTREIWLGIQVMEAAMRSALNEQS